MPALPASSEFTASTVSEAQFKSAISNQREFLAALLGTDGTPDAAKSALGVPQDPASNAATQTIWLPAAALTSRSGADGPTPEIVALSGNATHLPVLEFSDSLQQYAQFFVRMPEGWNTATFFSAQFLWTHATTTTNFGTAWSVRAKAINDTGNLDAAWGAAVQVNDTGGSANSLYRSPFSNSISPSGAPAPGSLVCFEFARVATDTTNDTLAVPARLLGVVLRYQTASLSDV